MKFKILLVLFVAVGSVALGELNIKVGDPVSQLVATLGEPRGITKNAESARYSYEAGTFIVKDGKIVSIPENFEASVQQVQAEKEALQKKQREYQAFAAEQRAKGLILYAGQWVTPDQKAKSEAAAIAANKKAEQQVLAANELAQRAKVGADAADESARKQAFLQGGMRWADVLLSPEKYVNNYNDEKGKKHNIFNERNPVTLRGGFHDRVGTAGFTIKQGEYEFAVFMGDLPIEYQREIMNTEKSSDAPVEVIGTIEKSLKGVRDSYFIMAKSVSFYK